MLGPDAEFVIGPLLFGPFGNQNGGLYSLPSLIVPAANMTRVSNSSFIRRAIERDLRRGLKYFILTIKILMLYLILLNQTL